MMKLKQNRLKISNIAGVLTLFVVSSFSADLKITVSGIRPSEGGVIQLYLYSKSTWMKEKKPVRELVILPSSAPSCEWVIHSLPDGEYAVRIVHDRDRNGVLTMKWTPPGPTEGYGFSNGYHPSGIPQYKGAAFEIHSEKENAHTEQILMTYPKSR